MIAYFYYFFIILSYYVLGRLPLLGSNFYTALPNVNELVAQSLFENVEWINNIHWKYLLNILNYHYYH